MQFTKVAENACVFVNTCTIGWAEKWKNDILKCADVDYHGTIYIKQGLLAEKIEFSRDSVHIFQNRFLHWNRGLKPVV